MFGYGSWKRKIKNEGYQKLAVIDHTTEALEYYKHWQEILKL